MPSALIPRAVVSPVDPEGVLGSPVRNLPRSERRVCCFKPSTRECLLLRRSLDRRPRVWSWHQQRGSVPSVRMQVRGPRSLRHKAPGGLLPARALDLPAILSVMETRPRARSSSCRPTGRLAAGAAPTTLHPCGNRRAGNTRAKRPEPEGWQPGGALSTAREGGSGQTRVLEGAGEDRGPPGLEGTTLCQTSVDAEKCRGTCQARLSHQRRERPPRRGLWWLRTSEERPPSLWDGPEGCGWESGGRGAGAMQGAPWSWAARQRLPAGRGVPFVTAVPETTPP